MVCVGHNLALHGHLFEFVCQEPLFAGGRALLGGLDEALELALELGLLPLVQRALLQGHVGVRVGPAFDLDVALALLGPVLGAVVCCCGHSLIKRSTDSIQVFDRVRSIRFIYF